MFWLFLQLQQQQDLAGTSLCAFQWLQPVSLTSALHEQQVLNVTAGQKPSSWTGTSAAQPQAAPMAQTVVQPPGNSCSAISHTHTTDRR